MISYLRHVTGWVRKVTSTVQDVFLGYGLDAYGDDPYGE